MPKRLLEQASLTESVDKKTGRILVDIVTPGVGSSGYYSPEVCEAAAGLVTVGTQMFIDHPTEAEHLERPIRSVKDIAAVFTESARWDPDRGEHGSLVAEARVVPAWVETMDVIQGAIGVSLRGTATDIVEGDRPDGSRGRVVEGLQAIDSVDFVTHAGRGGAFALLESARPSRVNHRALGHGVTEATVNDIREALQQELREAYGTGERAYVWVRDFDDTTVWFEVEDGDESGIYGQTYTEDDGVVALTGTRTEVRVQTTYVTATRPDSTTTSTTTTESKEDTMPKIQIEEAEHTRLVDEAGRVNTLLEERDTEKARGDRAEEALADRDRRDAARKIVEDSDGVFTPLEVGGLLAALPLKEGADGQPTRDLDVDAFTATVAEHAAAQKKAAGAGRVTGFGSTTDTGETVAESTAPTRSAWGRPLTEQKGA